MAASEYHERLVANLVSRGCSVANFGTAVRTIFYVNDETDVDECYASCVGGKTPDAWRIDEGTRRVYWYEVDTSSFLTEEKWQGLVALGWWLDDISWSLVLVRVDRFGNETALPLEWALVHAMRENTNPQTNPGFWLARLGAPAVAA